MTQPTETDKSWSSGNLVFSEFCREVDLKLGKLGVGDLALTHGQCGGFQGLKSLEDGWPCVCCNMASHPSINADLKILRRRQRHYGRLDWDHPQISHDLQKSNLQNF